MRGFFGWQHVRAEHSEIVLTEGEYDAMAVYQVPPLHCFFAAVVVFRVAAAVVRVHVAAASVGVGGGAAAGGAAAALV